MDPEDPQARLLTGDEMKDLTGKDLLALIRLVGEWDAYKSRKGRIALMQRIHPTIQERLFAKKELCRKFLKVSDRSMKLFDSCGSFAMYDAKLKEVRTYRMDQRRSNGVDKYSKLNELDVKNYGYKGQDNDPLPRW
jgi:hypothetical protein